MDSKTLWTISSNKRNTWLVSIDIKSKFLTVVTYQALHAALTNTIVEDSEILDADEDFENGENKKTVKIIDATDIVNS